MTTLYVCQDERRRNAVRAHTALNGIDFLEVVDDPQRPDERQRVLRVHFLKPRTAPPLRPDNVRIEGGERMRDVVVSGVERAPSDPPTVVTVRVSQAGDFSTYTLRLVRDRQSDAPPADLDPILASVDFSFKVDCPSDIDPGGVPTAAVDRAPVGPPIDYLARDYASIRKALLDRISTQSPEWQLGEAADLGTALVEVLAYVADHLSYAQDAIATEAYLDTARLRTSVRRHSRLVDYAMHDGCNARVWVHVQVTAVVQLPRGTRVLTREAVEPAVFETMHAATLRPEHNSIRLYTWGARECVLTRGATRATLRGRLAELRSGDVLILSEDRAHRHAVRLTRVDPTEDPLGGRFAEPPTDAPVPVTNVEWADDDALPFPLAELTEVLGNVVLADHGRLETVELGQVPDGRFRPALPHAGLTRAVPYDDRTPPASASAAMRVSSELARPRITLQSRLGETVATWEPKADLLSSGPSAREFVVEAETDGTEYVRFGDDRLGLRPAAGTQFTANYRVGNGGRGNVGIGALARVVSNDPAIGAVTNPLPAVGGTAPESLDEVRHRAPTAFHRQERAVTAEDVATLLGRHPDVQRATATVRWTGSWRTVFVSVDRRGGGPIDAAFEQKLRDFLEQFRMAGQDIEIEPPRQVSLEIELLVTVKSAFLRSHVGVALRDVFSSTRGLFHPDNFTFGQPVYLSPIYAAARDVAGVEDVQATVFQRLGEPSAAGLDSGHLPMRRLEIARLDNDPNVPEHGVLRLRLEGGA